MPDTSAMLQDGIAALKGGRKADAKRILTQIVDTEEDNEQGWLWLSACVDTPEEQQICLENVLAINPNNQKARKGLEAIGTQTSQKAAGAAAPRPAPPPAPTPPVSPGSSGDTGDFFTGFDTTAYSSPAPAPSTSSVEWGSTAGAPAYGSGKNVQLPSDEEYDHWVSSLNLGGSGSGSSPFTTGFDTNFDSLEAPSGGSTFDDPDPLGSDLSDPFGKSSFSFDKPAASISGAGSSGGTSTSDSFSGFGAPASSFDSFGNDSFAASGSFDDADPFGSTSGSFGSTTASTSTRSDPFGSQSSGGFGSDLGSDFGSTAISEDSLVDDPFGSSSFGSSTGGFRDDSAADLFSNVPHSGAKARSGASSRSSAASVDDLFDDDFSPPPTVDDLFDDDFGGSAVEDSPGGFVFGKSTGSARLGSQAYFKAIPEEIEAGGGFSLGKMDLRLALTVGGLGLLNAASLAAIVLALSGR